MVRGMRRRFAGVGVAAAAVVLAAVTAGNPVAGAAGGPSTSQVPVHPILEPPLRRVAPSISPLALLPSPSSPWTPLANQPSFAPGTMLLESNGAVMVQAYSSTGNGSGTWYELTPNAQGSYQAGTWTKVASMPAGYDPLYAASAILPSGQMIVEGGEYLGSTPAWTNKGAIYNPVTNTWKSVAPPAGWNNIGDAQSNVLANGTFMMAQACQNCLTNPTFSTQDALLNPKTMGWTVLPGKGKHDPNDEEGWSLLPSGKLLSVDAWAPPATETFTPGTSNWSLAGNTPTTLPNPTAKEIGPQVVMPGGNTFVVGAGTSPTTPTSSKTCTASTKPTPTAVYDYAAQRWTAGPSVPPVNGVQYDAADAPGSILPDGNVLFDVSPCVYYTTLLFYEYNPTTNSLTSVPTVPGASADSTYFTRMLALPTGQVLFNDGSQMLLYNGGGTPKPTWAPRITSVRKVLIPGTTAQLSGTQLAGLSQGAAYGDDSQSNTNFPIVRITNRSSGVVTYARTSNWSSVSIAPGASSSTDFSLPRTTPRGWSTVVVVANGIPSQPMPVLVL